MKMFLKLRILFQHKTLLAHLTQVMQDEIDPEIAPAELTAIADNDSDSKLLSKSLV